MTNLLIIILSFRLSPCWMNGLTPRYWTMRDEIKNAAEYGDAQHRGPAWYTETSNERPSGMSSSSKSDSSLLSDSSRESHTSETGSSSKSTEIRKTGRLFRKCTPCPHDMLKKYSNAGIKWICGAYQRARRTYKSECMMRYRNCQDGTMFVKIADSRCKNDSYYGRHWFYVYHV